LIAVAGMYRTGKSYLLNRMLLNRSDGFGVGPTINPCTKVMLNLKKILCSGSLDMGKAYLRTDSRWRTNQRFDC